MVKFCLDFLTSTLALLFILALSVEVLGDEWPLAEEPELEDPYVHMYMRSRKDQFDWKLFRFVSEEKENKNFVLSTFSTKLLLSILAEAADKDTKTQLLTVLPDLSQDKFRGHFKKIIESLEDQNDEYELKIGSKLYVDKHSRPATNFKDIARKVYHVPVEEVEFSHSEETAKKINDWCSEITNGKIKELVSADGIKEYVALLANALYFKGFWQYIFNNDDTYNSNFTVDKTKSVQVSMMTIDNEFIFKESKEMDAKLLSIPYKGEKYVMTLILPNEPDGLNNLTANLDPEKLQDVQREMYRTSVQLHLPKFEFKTSLELKDVLKKAGISKIFDTNADLPGLDPINPIYISDVIQKTGIVVNEEGTEIYAAGYAGGSARLLGNIFRADHPFIFFIEDVTTGAILFVGKVVDPTQK